MHIFSMILIRAAGLPLHTWELLESGIPDWAALEATEQKAAEDLLSAMDAALWSLEDMVLRTTVYNARKSFFQRRKLPSPGRIAILQADPELHNLLECCALFEKTQADKRSAEIHFEQILSANFRALQSLSGEETLRRALLFSSHDLLDSFRAFESKPVENLDNKGRRTALSTLQYLTRATFKTSPLGRFTTVQARALSAFGTGADRVGEWLEDKPQVTPNVALLPAIYEVLLRDPGFFQSLKLSLNPCISSPKGIGLQTIAQSTWLYFDGEREAFQQMEPNPAAELVLNILLDQDREMPYQKLMVVLQESIEATEHQLQDLVFKLIDLGLLEWNLPEKGLSPGWCGGLYQYLGYLPTSTVLSEAAYLLQWLRTAARSLPFLNIEAALELQQEALREAGSFFEKNGGELPPIPPEQIFFEDVAREVAVDLPVGQLEKFCQELADCWQQKAPHHLPPFRARLVDFAQKTIPVGGSIDFLSFSQQFLMESGQERISLRAPIHPGKLGALIQVYQENGEFKAVLNAMYPGGGKLFSRWLSLFPTAVTEQLKHWQNPSRLELAFPWQGWSNANFQPPISKIALSVPGGRSNLMPGGSSILLADLSVRLAENGFPELFEKQSERLVEFNDLGLEAPETRPPVMQVLWNLGVPYVSSESMLPEGIGWEPSGAIRYRRRMEYKSLVLARAAWELPPAVWEQLFSKEDSVRARRIGRAVASLKAMGIPRFLFGQFAGRREKPQFYDLESPVSMLLFEKNLGGGTGSLVLTEMLPAPEQCLGERATEFVVEFTLKEGE